MEASSNPDPRLSDKPKEHDTEQKIGFGSDAIAEQLSRLNLDYISLVPGSSYRGLHDSIVNLKGNANPEMLVCLHEEHAVSIAHGYAKVARKPMAVGLHANVGLMHAAMAIYNAWCDRVPMLVLGATGPLDATRRRPWIDWIHTAQDQAAIVRPYIKFDDQPQGVNAAISSLVHATVATSSKPCGPSYVCLDLGLQEDAVDASTLHFPDTERYFSAANRPSPSVEDVLKIVAALSESKRPLFLYGRMSPTHHEWQERIEVAEKFDVRVISDLKQAAPFPFPHKLQPSAPAIFISPPSSEMIRKADLIVAFDWIDLAGNLKAAGVAEPKAVVINISLDNVLHNGWSKDHFGIPPADVHIQADPDKTITQLMAASGSIEAEMSSWPARGDPLPADEASLNIAPRTDEKASSSDDPLAATEPLAANERAEEASKELPPASSSSSDVFMPDLAASLYSVISPDKICLVRVPLGWSGQDLRATHALSFMGMDGGAGIASGAGQVVGTALALGASDSNLIPVGIIGDGDFLMGSSALWTAARYSLPLLLIVANNGSYYNDEVHQERIANHRGRLVENKWIGMQLQEPQPDLHKIAAGLGCTVVRSERVQAKEDLLAALADALREVESGKPVVLDVKVLPEGYASAMSEKSK